jgi:hypothetical protein
MLIHVGFNIEFELPAASEAFFALSIHPSLKKRIRKGERLQIEPHVPMTRFTDPFGNACGRACLPAGLVQFEQRCDRRRQRAAGSDQSQSPADEGEPTPILSFTIPFAQPLLRGGQ